MIDFENMFTTRTKRTKLLMTVFFTEQQMPPANIWKIQVLYMICVN